MSPTSNDKFPYKRHIEEKPREDRRQFAVTGSE
jgi:hypothetical protein